MIAVRDYVADEAGTLWFVASLVTTQEGEFAVLLPAKPVVRFDVNMLGKREKRSVDGLTALKQITVTEKLKDEEGTT
jgi:hypothetical protein